MKRQPISAGLREQAQAHIALLESHRMWDGHANDYTIDLLTRLVSALPNSPICVTGQGNQAKGAWE
jgi:hypothetical protein